MTAAARGSLRREDGRLVRVIDPRLCDENFRAELRLLKARNQALTLEIVRDGQVEEGYRIEYAAPPAARTLGEAMAAETRWADRLRLLVPLCDSVDHWHAGPMSSAGLDPAGVLLIDGDGGSVAWLAPCPPVRLADPRDLLGVDETSLALLAPEVVRGLGTPGRPEDIYALGALAAWALGYGSFTAPTPAERVEAQARGALIDAGPSQSLMEPGLRQAGRIDRLVATIRRYRDASPDARPAGTRELRRAIVAATDLVALARDLRTSDPAVALRMLGQDGAGRPDDRIAQHRLAAEIAAGDGDPETALDHLDRAVALSEAHVDVRGERGDLLWRLWNERVEDRERIGERLLAELAFLRERVARPGVGLWVREAHVRMDRGDFAAALRALFAAEKLDGADLTILCLSGKCWRKLDRPANVEQVVDLAESRIRTLIAIGELSEQEGQRWLGCFRGL
jgi:hypothetical protein